MNIKRKLNFGQVSFLLAIIVGLYIMAKTILDYFLIDYKRILPISIEMKGIGIMSMISFIFGIIAVKRKEFKKNLCIFSLIISGSIIMPIIILKLIVFIKC